MSLYMQFVPTHGNTLHMSYYVFLEALMQQNMTFFFKKEANEKQAEMHENKQNRKTKQTNKQKQKNTQKKRKNNAIYGILHFFVEFGGIENSKELQLHCQRLIEGCIKRNKVMVVEMLIEKCEEILYCNSNDKKDKNQNNFNSLGHCTIENERYKEIKRLSNLLQICFVHFKG